MDFQQTAVKIPCCICGIMIEPNPNNMCVECFRRRLNQKEGVPEQLEINYCRDCGRYQESLTHWVNAELESKELLQICIKKFSPNLKIRDAKFLWTEPHSKRLRVQVTVDREDFSGTILRQSTIVTYIVKTVQCKTCQELATHRDHWKAIVQLRQHSDSKRSMFWIEQMIINNEAAKETSAIERRPDGLDFQFNDNSDAKKFISFIKSIIPVSVKNSDTVKGQDLVNMSYDIRYSYSLTIPSISREDLVLLPKKIFESTGRQSRLCLVSKMGRQIHFVNPLTGHNFVLDSKSIFSNSIDPLISHDRLTRFVVLSKDEISKNGDFTLADFELTDEETYGDRIVVRSHLGNTIEIGNVVNCYDLRSESFTDEAEKQIKKIDFERVIIVNKARDEKKNSRNKKVLTLAPTTKEDDRALEQFLDEMEDDPQLVSKINTVENDD
ncbi:NMD3 family protein [Trichomonas vaginalis G3]|uniref:60S ribosomal export protein NMD3 n=1 Tax=Trichomonas vaginalis (strain ATCC PRA-98 / G3) TaxID=412133 RepID=A2F1J4_TRIV3|nr:ribosomal large subunit binding [Trichomonas vaginalis G3]EAY01212.1 NMD3 family protein [Trichomonas vaginalis G3]KAI5532508.1 ribosomal large subunit binding [Trichomonas vaginalis G3]|eukprot:XP_001330128.1 NMD3 family protein [Trichomonas vaginalis G3]